MPIRAAPPAAVSLRILRLSSFILWNGTRLWNGPFRDVRAHAAPTQWIKSPIDVRSLQWYLHPPRAHLDFSGRRLHLHERASPCYAAAPHRFFIGRHIAAIFARLYFAPRRCALPSLASIGDLLLAQAAPAISLSSPPFSSYAPVVDGLRLHAPASACLSPPADAGVKDCDLRHAHPRRLIGPSGARAVAVPRRTSPPMSCDTGLRLRSAPSSASRAFFVQTHHSGSTAISPHHRLAHSALACPPPYRDIATARPDAVPVSSTRVHDLLSLPRRIMLSAASPMRARPSPHCRICRGPFAYKCTAHAPVASGIRTARAVACTPPYRPIAASPPRAILLQMYRSGYRTAARTVDPLPHPRRRTTVSPPRTLSRAGTNSRGYRPHHARRDVFLITHPAPRPRACCARRTAPAAPPAASSYRATHRVPALACRGFTRLASFLVRTHMHGLVLTVVCVSSRAGRADWVGVHRR
ncbi:hypothetical protein DFH06DRAFT_326417 [Mycena polygramma]|nr:hypothetical protein DFH06DRAFT_326417 [Mycena polygramma]